MTTLGPTAQPVALTFAQARRSPCLECVASPCCTHLMLRRFEVEDLGDIDYIMYLCNFEGILVGVDDEGVARAYLGQACGHLDTASGLCGVHGTQAQPSVCVHYNAHSCQYRHGMTADLNPRQPLLDARRAAWYAEHTTFADDRSISARPDWDELLAAFATMPLQRSTAPVPGPDPVRDEWRRIVLSPTRAGGDDYYEDRTVFDPVVSDPCSSCPAYCCETLVFSRALPTDLNQFDFFRYCLGFPSVEVAVMDDRWAVAVKTRCRHLRDGSCSVYDTDERPLRCGYYDAYKCTYRGHFGDPEPEDLVRVGRDEFGVLAASVVFDDSGQVRRLPTVELLRARIAHVVQASAPA